VSKYIIVGLDTGITSAFCILDLNGRVLAVKSFRNCSINKLIREVLKFGIPIVVACDVSRIPKQIRKIASKFNPLLIAPKHDLTNLQKEKLTKGINVKNKHERDAVASAIFSFKRFRRTFMKIDELKGLSEEEKEQIKKMIICGEVSSIGEAIK